VLNLQQAPGNLANLRSTVIDYDAGETLVSTIREMMQFQHPTGIEETDVRDMLNGFFPLVETEELVDKRTLARQAAERLKQADMRFAILKDETRQLSTGILESKIRQALWAQAISRPAFIVLKPLEFYAKYIGKPFVGTVISGGIQFNKATNSILGLAPNKDDVNFNEKFRDAREEGNLNWWLAQGEAFDNWEINGVMKFALEAVFDPLNLVGMGWFTKVLKPIPIIGKHLAALNQGYARAWELGFDAVKRGVVSAIPGTIRTRSLKYSRSAYENTRVYLEKATGIKLTALTPEKVQEVMIPAIDEALLNPQAPDEMVQAGLAVLDYPAVTPEGILEMAQIVPGTGHLTLDSITIDMLSKVNDGIEFGTKLSKTRWFEKEELADFLMLQLDIVKTTDGRSHTAMVKWIDLVIDANRTNAIRKITGENIIEIMQKIMNGASDDFVRAQRSLISNRRYQQGIYAGLARFEKVAHAAWFNIFDGVFTRPFARAYLLFAMFGPMNVLEVAAKTTLAGVNPFFKPGVHSRAASEFFALRGHVPLDVITPANFNIPYICFFYPSRMLELHHLSNSTN